MKIRHTLLLLTAFLGLALLLAVTVQIRSLYLEYQTAQRMVASNAAREQLLLAAAALAEERSRTYVLLIGAGGEGSSLDEAARARRQVDALLKAAHDEIASRGVELRDAAYGLASLSRIGRDLAALRRHADEYLTMGRQGQGRDVAQRWFREATQVVEELHSSRLTLLQQERPQEPVLLAEATIRVYGGILSESIARNQALMTGALSKPERIASHELQDIGRNSGRAMLAWDLVQSQLTTPLSETVKAAIASSHEEYDTTFAPLQDTFLTSLLSGVKPAVGPGEWYVIAQRSLVNVAAMQQELLRSSRERLEEQLAQARRSVASWMVLLLGGIAAVFASILVVRMRVAQPLEGLSSAMLRLADNDLSTPLPRLGRRDEIGEMSDALRTFKANALRRQREQNDRQALHGLLQEAYRLLRNDLEAAAAIQRTMLPAASTLGLVQHRGLFRPSSLIAGDTYNVVQLGEGRVGFFQIDVAGHGAGAALVSVASHHTLSQALLTQADGVGLDEIVDRINREWPGDLPYFTMILGRIDVRNRRLTMVQAGHPSPLLVRPDESVEVLGDGGFPVGMVPVASYETLETDFGPGDRLIVYSDGLVEAENAEGEQFSEARLRGFVQEQARNATPIILEGLDGALRNWRGSETLTDDLSVLMLDRLSERTIDAHL
jgi:serine phosphatase RsbU (regulator of sigma subunit)